MKISIQTEPFDYGELSNHFALGHSHVGAVVTFCGIVRNDAHGDLSTMEIEHYPGMTEKAIKAHTHTAKDRFSLSDVLVIHRYGSLAPGEIIMMVATAAPHRHDAFQGAEFLMDYLKSRAPFWKKEIVDGHARWVDAKPEDEDVLSRW